MRFHDAEITGNDRFPPSRKVWTPAKQRGTAPTSCRGAARFGWQRKPLAAARERLLQHGGSGRALTEMVRGPGCWTPYQAARIGTNNTSAGFGNCRILERSAPGGMAVVYKKAATGNAAHRRHKVLPCARRRPRLESRFSAEMRAVARLLQPTLLAPMDAGGYTAPTPRGQVLWALLWFRARTNLDDLCALARAVAGAQACNRIHQSGRAALAETPPLQPGSSRHQALQYPRHPEKQAKLLEVSGLSAHVPDAQTQFGPCARHHEFHGPRTAA